MKTLCPSPSASAICAIVSTFDPEPSIRDNVSAALLQVDRVIVVDDGGANKNKAALESWFGAFSRVTLIHNPRNLGIAHSLNKGITVASGMGYRWFLMLDDDTLPLQGMVDCLYANYQRLSERFRIGLIGMDYASTPQTNGIPDDREGPGWSLKRGVITSGSLISLPAYRDIGIFREEFFIDLVDYEYCLRARRKGYRIVQIERVGFVHRLGNPAVHRIVGFQFTSYNRAPERLYYQARNGAVLLREYFAIDAGYCLGVCLGLIKTSASILVYEENKTEKLGAMAKGVAHAIGRRMGRVRRDERWMS